MNRGDTDTDQAGFYPPPPKDGDGEDHRALPVKTRISANRGVWQRKRLLAVIVIVLGLLLIAGKFFAFANKVAHLQIPKDPRADAIVVLTGGTERVQQAIHLLGEGHAGRLLISGVHPGTTPKQIAYMTKTDMPLLSCCVDLDRVALNTEGNALETARWMAGNGFSSLILVTSAYHLPRAQTELASVMPGIRMIPYPVYSSELDLKAWYRSPATTRLLIREYSKYTLAGLRVALVRAGKALGL
ncbi:YdcF family protein [Roseibium sp. RKSG952]|uniref:YdcF family protein n=1 Tax=Roseibium sp. RKSG952 TaxID=2529384 RepID=UPI0012BD2D3C|nr:YdcF family protein [Roseibium sp. RKSG952]MTH96458.1 YdcF family protein [Roseibium sp. RKSG952]